MVALTVDVAVRRTRCEQQWTRSWVATHEEAMREREREEETLVISDLLFLDC